MIIFYIRQYTGLKHSVETRTRMSKSQQHLDRTGALNPMFGKVPTHSITVNVYSLDNVLVSSFSSQIAAAKWLNTSPRTVSRYIESGKVWNNQYMFRKSSSYLFIYLFPRVFPLLISN